ncbi:MAG: type IV toxin-antitoxin system AbiEi family antitoxin [Jatrophihabitantaceae bacterium]
MPPALARFPLRTFRAAEATVAYAHPDPQLRRLDALGLLHRLAHGYYTVVPQDSVGIGWMPILEAAAAGISSACFRPAPTPLMGVSAARALGALPRALNTAIIAAPAQHDPITLLDRPATIRFIKRDTTRLDVESVATELGRALVTSVEQTILDLARKPPIGVAEDQIPEALRALLPRADQQHLRDLARTQRLRSALTRVALMTQ